MDFLGWGAPPKIRVTCRKFVIRSTGTALLINCLTIRVATNGLSWVSPWHPALSKTKSPGTAGTAGEPKCIVDGTVVFSIQSYLETGTLFQCAQHRANACRLRLANFFLHREEISATSLSHWGDSCPNPSAHEAGEPVLCLVVCEIVRGREEPWEICPLPDPAVCPAVGQPACYCTSHGGALHTCSAQLFVITATHLFLTVLLFPRSCLLCRWLF